MIVTSLVDMQMNEQRQTVQPPPRRDPARPIATAFMSLADQSKALALALRYESRLRRIHERAFNTLRELQREPKMESANPDSADPSGTDDGGRGIETRPETKRSEGEQAPPAARPRRPAYPLRPEKNEY